jgi:hypothetical protein
MLVTAASGLEKTMSGTNTKIIKDSSIAQISAAIYYQANVIAKLEKNKGFQKIFRETIYNQIEKDFGLYIDSKARTNPKSLHHVYEWKKTGNRNNRLFKLNMISEDKMSFKINYEFLPSKSFVPHSSGRRRHVFANKAAVMEAGMPLIIRPRSSERLVFNFNGITTFMPKGASVTVKRPGGAKASNQFNLAYSQFFKGRLVNESIKKSGFKNIFSQGIAKSLKIPNNIKRIQYSFSPNTVRSQADAALASAFGGYL